MIARPSEKRHVRHSERLLGNCDETSDGKVPIQRCIVPIRDNNIHRGRISGSIGPADGVTEILNPVTGGGRRVDGDGGEDSRGQ